MTKKKRIESKEASMIDKEGIILNGGNKIEWNLPQKCLVFCNKNQKKRKETTILKEKQDNYIGGK